MFVGETISLTDPINRYGVAEDQRALHSIRSASQKIGNSSNAYEVDFSKHYKTEAEALAARDQIYGDTSIYLSAKADKLNNFATSNIRSISASEIGCEDAGKDWTNGEQRLQTAKEFWADFQNDDTYKALEKKGGASTKEDISKLLSAAERYRWQKSYKEYGVYEQDMFDFADKLTENTGVTVVTRGKDDNISFTNDDSICTMDNYTFQFMATHQEHMDLWEDVVKGKYNNFSDITKAIKDTGDYSLVADWNNAHPRAKNYEKYGSSESFFHGSDKYGTAQKYAMLSVPNSTSGEDFGSSSQPGITAKDYWNEFRFNTGMTDTLTGKFAMSGTIKDDGSIEWYTSPWLDPDKKKPSSSTYTNRSQNNAKDSTAPTEKYNQQIDSIKEKIKKVRNHLSLLQKYSAGQQDENTQKLIAADQKQISSYQKQIESIQMQSLEYQKQHLTD